ncbi:serpin-ZX [Artemisia annua]|uniref:Serpin-ZX n=1 Tax=Artemisia annua TaxID=35608 RepID=A0A2U1MXL1_ARTAN|nr:serpin-ZX [Artemisia annua]
MAEASRRNKKSKQNIIHDDSYLPLVKKQKKVAPKITSVATKVLLDDALKGFTKGNFVCSPFSLEILLGMLAFGATSQTLKQLLEFLGHETLDQLRCDSPISKLFAQILANPNGGNGSLEINLANRVWVAKKLSPVCLLSSYKELISTFKFRKIIHTVIPENVLPMENNAPKAVRKINAWADKKTKGLIPNVVTKNDLTVEEDLVFANALYFKGIWSNPFKANMAKEKKFKLINGETVLAPFMTNYDKFHYGSFSGYSMLEIPYESKEQSKLSMYIFLPDRKDGLQDLLQVFHSDNTLFYGDFNLERRKLDEVWIPKFKITYKFEAHDVMEEMGLILPFDPNNKEITEIVGERIYVSKVLQKSFIEVDERGTEAAAVSLMFMERGCPRPPTPPPPASFVADHPFMFMIREDASRAVFFIGVVLNPV